MSLFFALTFMLIFKTCFTVGFKATNFGTELSARIEGQVWPKGSPIYEKRRLVHNGLCKHLYPDWIVVPVSTKDVSETVKTAVKYNVSLSVRSGGHSYTCTSIKQGGVLIDLRSLNKIQLISPHLAVLGPGSTWADVLQRIPPHKYTLIHGQCTSVGIGGFILGGGVNIVGTSDRYGSATDHVERFTMVDSRGRTLLVSHGNVTVIDPISGRASHQLRRDFGLFTAMMGAGSSFGIVTEFLYKIYPRPETLPIVCLIYVESPDDLRKLEMAGLDGRYSITLSVPYAFRDLSLSYRSTGIKIIPKLLMKLAMKTVEPVFAYVVDLHPNAGRYTDRQQALNFLKSYGINLAKDGIFASILPTMADISDYEAFYMSPREYKKRGFQALASANMLNLSSLKILDNFLFHHPVFGLKNKESKVARNSGCEFCFLVAPLVNSEYLPLTHVGNANIELTCMYPPNSGSRCPKMMKNIKETFRRIAVATGDSPTQYTNTPTCDLKGNFQDRYFSPGVYEKLLKVKRYWDPQNIFNHCQSIGNNDQTCCP